MSSTEILDVSSTNLINGGDDHLTNNGSNSNNMNGWSSLCNGESKIINGSSNHHSMNGVNPIMNGSTHDHVISKTNLPVYESNQLSDGPSNQQLIVFDTTLRDGEQSPGVALSTNEKVEIAHELSRLGVHIIEGGFPASGAAEFEAVRAICREVGSWASERKDGIPPIICGFSRTVKRDIEICYEALKEAPRKRLNICIATSDIHLEYKLKITRQECLERAVSCVKYAKSLCDDVEFSAEDSARSDDDFLCSVYSAVIEAGATTVNFADTVGYDLPEMFYNKLKKTIQNTKGGKDVIWCVHCHNDLGLATANTLAGIKAGARQVDVTINGIGERAGNAGLEEVIMAVHTHPTLFPVNVSQIETQRLTSISRLVSNLSGMLVQPNKAIVGANAFVHESGIHQDGILKNSLTYEIISPKSVGLASHRLLIGKHSGRAGFKNHLVTELGLGHLNEEQIEDAYLRYKTLNTPQPAKMNV